MFNTLLIEPLANGLKISYDIFFQNLGLAIIFFSIFLKFVTYPLVKPYMNSMKKMREVAPLLEKLKIKHKDKLKLAQAQSELYKQKGIKPAAGCLPYVLQIVILIAFFRMFMLILNGDSSNVEAFNRLLYEPLKFAEGETLNKHFLYLDLAQPDTFKISSIPFPVPGLILILASLAQFLSAKVMQPYTKVQEKIAKKTKEATDDFQVAMQKSMIYTFPLFTLFIGMSFASGLALYWLIFSVVQLFQQYKSTGLGGLTPWVERLKTIKSTA